LFSVSSHINVIITQLADGSRRHSFFKKVNTVAQKTQNLIFLELD